MCSNGSNGSGESRSKWRVLLHFDFLSATQNVLHCVVSRRKPTLEDCPWATPILRKVIWDVKGAMCKVWQPRAIFNKFWRHKASSFEVLLPWTESGFCKHILVKSDKAPGANTICLSLHPCPVTVSSLVTLAAQLLETRPALCGNKVHQAA